MKKMRNNDSQAATPRQPLISIITVVLNGATTLERAIKSVICRKYKDFEYIIVDGGSVNKTRAYMMP
jgi:glycosyltransferase involved in cell wall biosynthesis